MKRLLSWALIIGLTGIVLSLFIRIVAAPEPPNNGIEGTWLGALDFSGEKLRIVFNITRNDDGSFISTLDSPDQGAKAIPVAETTFKDRKLHLEVSIIKGSFDGTLSEDGAKLEGSWQQNGNALPLTLERTTEIPETAKFMTKPQDPKKPYPYDEKEVSYTNPAAGIKLAGTLTLPRSKKPVPAVLLITGSGAQDRNESIMGHRPFLVLADYLTRQGIAVLRVDDRGVGGSTGSMEQATSKDFAGDVLAGVNYLKGLKEINPKQIGLIGHSEGGLIAPMVAVESKDVAYIVLMAGPGTTGEQVLYRQTGLILKAQGVDEPVIKRQLDILDGVFAILRQEKDERVIQAKIHDWAVTIYDELSPEEKKTMGNSDAVEKQLQVFVSPWFRFFLAYDPAPALKKVTCPVLAITGSKDLQVPPKENLAAIRAALTTGGNKDFLVKELPGLNHLFQTCKTGSPAEYGMIQETVSPAALKLMADWIIKHTKR